VRARAGEKLLGERRTLVRRLGLGPDENDPSLITLDAKGFGAPGAGEPSSGDEDAAGCASHAA
jgi:hypothetical protein